MSVEPIIQGVVAKNANPLGCEKSVVKQIDYVKERKSINSSTQKKRVLILGCSSGLGLASRIALTFGDANADTIGVSLDRAPTTSIPASAGFYNNFYFKEHAEAAGHVAVNLHGDLFQPDMKARVVEAIETYFEGEVDLVIYSVATAKRRVDQKTYHSVIKPMNKGINAHFIDFSNDTWSEQFIDSATEDEIDATRKTMGGEEWEYWIDTLINSESIAQGCETIAFSYIGSEITHPIYLDGTLGHAKVDLHQASHSLNRELINFQGAAHVAVCQALVTRSSVVIPNLCQYVMALNEVLEEQDQHETPISQAFRLFYEKLNSEGSAEVDAQRLIRLDENELNPITQKRVLSCMNEINSNNFTQFSAYQKLKASFLRLNGFGWDDVDYQTPIDLNRYLEHDRGD